MTSLTKQDADRLAKLLGMLSSDHMGERAAAGAKADQMLRSRGLTWGDIIKARQAELDPATKEERIAFVLAHASCLTMWEEAFLYSINGRRTLSLRQLTVLDRLVEKCRAYAASRQ
ncbi:MAG: hypothetical protein WBE89_20320 [Methyloceanibacter sp.]|jgi:hypothetical protein